MKRIILAALAAAVMLPSAASAASSSTLHHREHRQRLTIHRDVGTLRFFHNHRWLAVTPAGVRALRFARAELGWTRREVRETRGALRPAIGHLAGWRCITYGAHPGTPGDPHEGHGVSAAGYRGALQMTRTWSGYTMSWESMSDVSVYAIAERVAAAHHFDPGWMSGQWPRTYPPCASRF